MSRQISKRRITVAAMLFLGILFLPYESPRVGATDAQDQRSTKDVKPHDFFEIGASQAFATSDELCVLINVRKYSARASLASGAPWRHSGCYVIRAGSSSVQCLRVGETFEFGSDLFAWPFAYKSSVFIYGTLSGSRESHVYRFDNHGIKVIPQDLEQEILNAAELRDKVSPRKAKATLMGLTNDTGFRIVTPVTQSEGTNEHYECELCGSVIDLDQEKCFATVRISKSDGTMQFMSQITLR